MPSVRGCPECDYRGWILAECQPADRSGPRIQVETCDACSPAQSDEHACWSALRWAKTALTRAPMMHGKGFTAKYVELAAGWTLARIHNNPWISHDLLQAVLWDGDIEDDVRETIKAGRSAYVPPKLCSKCGEPIFYPELPDEEDELCEDCCDSVHCPKCGSDMHECDIPGCLHCDNHACGHLIEPR